MVVVPVGGEKWLEQVAAVYLTQPGMPPVLSEPFFDIDEANMRSPVWRMLEVASAWKARGARPAAIFFTLRHPEPVEGLRPVSLMDLLGSHDGPA